VFETSRLPNCKLFVNGVNPKTNKMVERKRPRIALLDISDHVTCFEDDLFRRNMFQESFCDFKSFFVTKNEWPEGDVVETLTTEFDGVVISGSDDSCMDDSLPYIKQMIFLINDLVEMNFPLLGVCFGSQIIIRTLFGNSSVAKSKEVNAMPEFGVVAIDFTDEQAQQNPLLKGIEKTNVTVAFYITSSHSDVFILKPDDEKVIPLLKSRWWPHQAYQIKNKWCFGVQFHPEMDKKQTETEIKMAQEDSYPTLNDDDRMEPDMHVGIIMGKNFCEIASHGSQLFKKND